MPAEQKHPHHHPPPPPPPPQQQQQQWRVKVHARSRNFSVEVRSTTPIPTWKWSPREPHRVSILLRLWSFAVRLQSDCGAGPPRQRWRFPGSGFHRALERIRGFRAKKRAVVTREADKAEIGIRRPSLVLVLISAFLLRAISVNRLDKIGAGLVAVASAILVHASKKSFARQASLALVLLSLLSMARSSSRLLDLAKYVDFTGDWARGILWKIWKSAAS